jgi:hypothetical protein
MVNVVYRGVVRVFKALEKYMQDFQHEITGVGGKKTRIVAKLCDIPIIIGRTAEHKRPHYTTFYVIDNDDYHWILGLPLLAQIQGSVLCKERILAYKNAGEESQQKLQMISRREAQQKPVRAEFRLRSPHLEAETAAAECWEASMLHQEEASYVGEDLVDLLGKIHVSLSQTDSQLTHPQANLASHTYQVDQSLTELPDQSGNSSSTEVLVEQI